MLARLLGALAALLFGGALGLTLASVTTSSEAWGGAVACVVLAINAGTWAFIVTRLPASRGRVAAARAAGRSASARVESVAPTNTTINDAPIYRVVLTVDPGDRAPYRAVTKATIDHVISDVPRAGMIVAVVELDPILRTVALDPESPIRPFRDGAVVSVHDVADAPIDGSAPRRSGPVIKAGPVWVALTLTALAAVASYLLAA